jgi:hypothetical protein
MGVNFRTASPTVGENLAETPRSSILTLPSLNGEFLERFRRRFTTRVGSHLASGCVAPVPN